MKFTTNIKKPSPKKMISSYCSVKKQLVNRLGLKMGKGWGWARNPKKYIYNKIYRYRTFDTTKHLRNILKYITRG